MKKALYSIAIALISLIIVSCGDKNPVNPTTNDNFLSSGSSWITEYTDLDSNGTDIPATLKLDTLTLLESRLVRGKTAFPLFDGKDTTMYMYFSGKSLYITAPTSIEDSTSEGDPFSGLFGMDWMKVADFDSKLNDSWLILEKDTTMTIDLGGSPLPAQLNVKVNVTNIGEKTYHYGSVNTPVTQFKVTIKVNMVAMGGLINAVITMETMYDISYTKGIMKTEDLGQSTKITYLGQVQDQKIPGSTTKTIKYTIK
jgi:hypothetical protein